MLFYTDKWLLQERKAREEREMAARVEEEARRMERELELLEEKRKQYIRYLCKTLPAEPDASYEGQIAKLSFRLADGERVIRKFRQDESLEVLTLNLSFLSSEREY